MKPNITKRTLLIVSACAALGLGYYAFRLFSTPIDFAYYEPSYVPAGVTITEKRISIVDNGSIRAERASLRMEKVGWEYSINQYKRDETTDIGNADQNLEDSSRKPTCSFVTSPKKMKYRLCHWIDNWESHGGSEVSVYEVKFIKGDTYFWGRIPTVVTKPISVDEINKFIDSFEQKSTDGVPIVRSRYFV